MIYRIAIWENKETRNEGSPIYINTKTGEYFIECQLRTLFGIVDEVQQSNELILNELTEIIDYVNNMYKTYLKRKRGSIEIETMDDLFNYKKNIYHISIDSKHTLKQLN